MKTVPLVLLIAISVGACVPATPFDSKVKIRWFVGLGTGTSPEQVTAEEEVVKEFNASQSQIELILEIAPGYLAYDDLATQFANGQGPDLIGPLNWDDTNAFRGQWLDLAPYIEKSEIDLTVFEPTLLSFYQTTDGQVTLPFAVYPAAMYYNPAMFDEVGLAYPPQTPGELYRLPDGMAADWNWDTVSQVARLLTIDSSGRNATEPGFDRAEIIQVGYSPYQQSLNTIATLYAGPAKIFEGELKGEYQSAMPAQWQAAFEWYYAGIWGAQPFMASGGLAESDEFGNGNLFNAGKAAMVLARTSYTCCVDDIARSESGFQLGLLPLTAEGVSQSWIETDSFRIWKGTQHPQESFQVLAYLITQGSDRLLPAYGALSARTTESEAFIVQKSNEFPSVSAESWQIFMQGRTVANQPSAEPYQPNWIEAYTRERIFLDRLNTTPPDKFDLNHEFNRLKSDLTRIYNK